MTIERHTEIVERCRGILMRMLLAYFVHDPAAYAALGERYDATLREFEQPGC
jgi:hypothetical protein